MAKCRIERPPCRKPDHQNQKLLSSDSDGRRGRQSPVPLETSPTAGERLFAPNVCSTGAVHNSSSLGSAELGGWDRYSVELIMSTSWWFDFHKRSVISPPLSNSSASPSASTAFRSVVMLCRASQTLVLNPTYSTLADPQRVPPMLGLLSLRGFDLAERSRRLFAFCPRK